MLILAAALGFQFLYDTPSGDRLFEGPVAVRCHSNGHVYVTDDVGHRISIFDTSGRRLRTLGTQGALPGQLMWPDGVHWDDDGRLYVADAGANRIQVWSGEGRHIRDIGRHPRWRRALAPLLGLTGAALLFALLAVAVVPVWRRSELMLSLAVATIVAGGASLFLTYGTFEGLRNPRDVLVGPDGLVYVADFNGHAVRVFNRDGALIRSIGSSGPKSARLSHPLGLAFSSGGLLFVSDSDHHRVQVFQRDGQLVRMFGQRGSASGEFMNPHGIAIGKDGRVYVADRGNRRIHVWDAEGFLLGTTSEGRAQGFTPGGIDVCDSGELVIADINDHRIIVRSVDDFTAAEFQTPTTRERR